MSRTAHLRIPFFDAQHRAFADELDEWAGAKVADIERADAARRPVRFAFAYSSPTSSRRRRSSAAA